MKTLKRIYMTLLLIYYPICLTTSDFLWFWGNENSKIESYYNFMNVYIVLSLIIPLIMVGLHRVWFIKKTDYGYKILIKEEKNCRRNVLLRYSKSKYDDYEEGFEDGLTFILFKIVVSFLISPILTIYRGYINMYTTYDEVEIEIEPEDRNRLENLDLTNETEKEIFKNEVIKPLILSHRNKIIQKKNRSQLILNEIK